MKLSTRGLLAATLLPFALAVALASFWSLRSEERLQDALAMAARAGMPGRLEEVTAWLDERFGPLDPGDNGGPLVLEALDMLRGRSLSDLDWEQAAPLDLPPIDAILISHDHYDHLDLLTVEALRDRPIRWLVPLGIGAHLEYWGVPAERIQAMDWWEETTIGELRVTATPARHFSGRWLDRFRSTLWVGWALRGPEHAVFYSGDTALFPELADIGERLGPFDMTFMDAGAYDATWTDVHLGPEQTVVAHRMVQGKVLVPVHWGLFDLGNHGWTEPMERVRAAAARFDIDLRSPKPGESVELEPRPATEPWWPREPVRTLAEDPVWSTSVDGVLDRWWGPR